MSVVPARRGVSALALLLLPAYAAFAYVVVPAAWSRYERRLPTPEALKVTYTAERIPADPLNVALVGTRRQVIAAMLAAGWTQADPITLRSGLRDASSILLDRAYPSAPVSTHFLWNRPQDLAFEQTVGKSPRRRHHVRFWRSAPTAGQAASIWMGAATYDRAIGLSRYTGEVMHHIDPRVDEEREKLFGDLSRAGWLDRVERLGRFRPAGRGFNGGGDAYETDGSLLLGLLKRF
ncbi:MAG: LssY C-terminal domain-containing protein [Acidobacteriota bacterium]